MRTTRFSIIALTAVIFYAVLGVSVMAQETPEPELISEPVFSDLDDLHVNFDAIMYVQEREIVDGYPDGTYKPDDTINRAEFTKILVGSAYDYDPEEDTSDIDIYSSGEFTFPDIEDQAWYIPYLRVAVNNEVIEGYPDGTFRPDDDVNFAEAAKIIVTSFDYESVTDDEVWYKGFVDVLAAKGAIPTSIESFEQQITRGEMAEMIYRVVGLVTYKDSNNYTDIYILEGGEESGVATKEEIAETVEVLEENVSLYFGHPTDNVAVESYPLYFMDCFEEEGCPIMPLYSDEWTINTKDRIAFDTARNVIYYPRVNGVMQVEKFDPETEKTFITGFEEIHDMSYRPYIYGDTMAVAVMDSGKETVVKYDLLTEEEASIPVFDEYDGCTWPAISADEEIYAVCNNLQTTFDVVDENGNVYYTTDRHLESMVIDINGIAYFVEEGFVIVLDLASKTARGTDVIPPYHIVYTLAISPGGRYLAGMGEVSGEWVVGIYDRSTLILTMPVQLDAVPGVPVFGPYMESESRDQVVEEEPPAEPESA
jgi:hypothetical protein